MNASQIWTDLVPDREGVKSVINDVAISPDGTRVVVAVTNRVLLYDAESGSLLESLRGHKETVNTVDYSYDGSRFASGGNDNTVVIWKNTGQGMLKYTHQSPIQKIKFSPISIVLCSCSEGDIGFWNPDQKNVTKEKILQRAISCAWCAAGNATAVGLISGTIIIYNTDAVELSRTERKCPIWCLTFISNPNVTPSSGATPQKESAVNAGGINLDSELLVAGCWDKSLVYYKFVNNNPKVSSEKQLTYYPTDISLVSTAKEKASYMIITGSNKKASLYSRDGVCLSDLITRSGWIWCCRSNTAGDRLIIGSDNGHIDMMKMDYTNVLALNRDRYGYRDNLTDIIVHHLTIDKKVRIKCKDLVQKIALFKNKLAVQLTDRVMVYESSADDLTDIHFKVRKERMYLRATASNLSASCDHLAVTSQNILFCRKHVIESYLFTGARHRVWRFETSVNYMRCAGGPTSREGVIVGLESGAVLKIYIDNPFPVELTKCPFAITSADLSLDKSKIATVDIKGILTVSDLKTQDVLFTAQNVKSVCFNTEVNDMICYSTDKSIFVLSGIGVGNSKSADKKVANEPQEQYISGHDVIGYQGQKIYCIYRQLMSTIDVPQGANMTKALDIGDFKAAYSCACLGATESDWRQLALRALRANELEIAKNAYARLKDVKHLSFIEQYEKAFPHLINTSSLSSGPFKMADTQPKAQMSRNRGGGAGGAAGSSIVGSVSVSKDNKALDPLWNAELLAYEGFHNEAAKKYASINKIDEAIRLFVDLKRWDDAKVFSRNAGVSDVSNLTMQQAKWLQDTNDWENAATLYMSLGNQILAAKIVADNVSENGPWKKILIEIVRATPSENIDVLSFCGDTFAKANEDEFARETYTKYGEISKVMQLLAKRHMWSEAAQLAEKNEGKFECSVFLPYAEWLVSEDKFDDAMKAYKKAGRKDLATKVLLELTKNAVSESRFKDASHCYWLLSKETENEFPELYSEYVLKADLYFAYANVHSFITDPFTGQNSDMLFQVSRFIINSLGNSESTPKGISKANTLYTLAKQALKLGAFKLARHAFDRLIKLKLPENLVDEIELNMLIVQAKPVRDGPDTIPVCFRCGTNNPLLNPYTNKFAKGDVCTNCGHPFVRSFHNFEVLSLVEFVPDPSISDEDAIEMIRQPPPGSFGRGGGGGVRKGGGNARDKWSEGKDGEANFMRLDDDDDYGDNGGMSGGLSSGDSLFNKCSNQTIDQQSGTYLPITVDSNTLLAMKGSEIYVCKPSTTGKRATFYKNMLPDIQIAISQPCHRFFHLEDFEFSYLSNKGCPYSKQRNVGEYGSL